MLGTIFSWRERERALKRKEKKYIYIYILMCTVNLRTKNYERKQCYIKTQRERERASHFLTWAAYILRLRDKLYN